MRVDTREWILGVKMASDHHERAGNRGLLLPRRTLAIAAGDAPGTALVSVTGVSLGPTPRDNL